MPLLTQHSVVSYKDVKDSNFINLFQNFPVKKKIVLGGNWGKKMSNIAEVGAFFTCFVKHEIFLTHIHNIFFFTLSSFLLRYFACTKNVNSYLMYI